MVATLAGMTDGASGETLASMAGMLLPDAAQTRRALLRLRREHDFARGKLAAILAVSPHTVRRWEDGKRRPSASARRLVQLVERLYFRPGDFPAVPIGRVLSLLTTDMADAVRRLEERHKGVSPPNQASLAGHF